MHSMITNKQQEGGSVDDKTHASAILLPTQTRDWGSILIDTQRHEIPVIEEGLK